MFGITSPSTLIDLTSTSYATLTSEPVASSSSVIVPVAPGAILPSTAALLSVQLILSFVNVKVLDVAVCDVPLILIAQAAVSTEAVPVDLIL